MKKLISAFFAFALVCALAVSACAESAEAVLPDGVYTAEFRTDSSMFHANEACDGRGVLIVSGGEMTIHVSLVSKTILNLFPGLKEDAQQADAVLLQPTEDEVTYSDGYSETVYGFDIPVPVLDEEFDLALVGRKGVWYDHKVSVTDPQPYVPSDGTWQAEVTLAGGSGKASVLSPCELRVSEGVMTAVITWSSSKYDYMLLDGVRYEPLSTENGSVFEIPVSMLGAPIAVIADTTAMGNPHEIEYTLTFGLPSEDLA